MLADFHRILLPHALALSASNTILLLMKKSLRARACAINVVLMGRIRASIVDFFCKDEIHLLLHIGRLLSSHGS